MINRDRNKIKEERFERVIEWERERDGDVMIIGITLMIFGLLGIGYAGEEVTVQIFLLILLSIWAIVSGVLIFLFGLGEKKDAYWRKI